MPRSIFVDPDTYDLIPRVSEIIACLSCSARSHLHPVNSGKKKWKSVNTLVALKGTLLHHRIQNHCLNMIGLPPEPLELTAGDRQLYNRAVRDPEMLKWINGEIEKGWNNFLIFMKEFDPEIVAVELSMLYIHKRENGEIDPARSLSGTVDLICEFDPERMSEKALKMFPITEPVTCILDWKSGSAVVDTHHAQLEAYDELIVISGEWDALVDEGIIRYPQAYLETKTGRTYTVSMCVLLGGKSFKAGVYNMDEGLWTKAKEIFFAPTLTVKTTYKSGYEKVFREGYHCVFCPHRDQDCPIFNVVDQTPKDVEVKLL